MGVRKPNNHGRKNLCKVASRKNNKTIWCESLLERDYCYLIEIDSSILSYQEQPLRVNYLLDNTLRIYTPDFLLILETRKIIVEVKPFEKSQEEEMLLRTKCVKPILEKEGYEYLIVTEREIRKEPRLSNVKLLYKYANTRLNSHHQIILYDFFKNRKTSTIREVEDIYVETGMKHQIVMALIYHGFLKVDISQKLDSDTIVSLP